MYLSFRKGFRKRKVFQPSTQEVENWREGGGEVTRTILNTISCFILKNREPNVDKEQGNGITFSHYTSVHAKSLFLVANEA